MDNKLALKVNKFIHEQCIDGIPHDIGWNVLKLIEEETQLKLLRQPPVIKLVCECPRYHSVNEVKNNTCDECKRDIIKQTVL